ncbi:flavin-containing amine oxidase [Penicillium cataractarum]|uniref:Amine oxidase n=1 Tax=Penicillium cataractarum TaxID=2100454 RepID=A0A9W9V6A3_9EURO|nr:flavin-containing amine oxidase [Penicillium cataractarum]KAJ5370317.1 flavin-containing amine oxidase [Penicillium cataractarum]
MTASKNVYDVIVVGAGLSGLQAAQVIQAAGFTVCVLEATNRVGGKTSTVKSSEKGYNDLGAAWINDTNQSEMFKLFQKYDLDTEVQLASGDTIVQLADGSLDKVPYGQVSVRILRNESSVVDLDDPLKSHNAVEIDQLTFKDLCVQRTHNEQAIRIADLISTALLGVDSDEVSALYMLHYFKSGCGIDNLLSDGKDGGQYLRNRQGNQTISKKLAEELGSRSVFLSNPVASVDQLGGGHGVVVATQSGESFYGRKAIISVPTTLYPSITFNPPLPPKKTALSDNTVMGYYSKTVFVFKEPWWRTSGLSGIFDSEIGPISFTRDTSIPADDQWSITCFIVGERGRQWSKLSKAARHKQAWEQFSQTFGKYVKDIPEPTNSLEMEWAKQGYFLGAPCPVMTPGILTTVGTELATPFGDVHFVGTETATVWRGYMEGAVRSGQRGGAEVVKELVDELSTR